MDEKRKWFILCNCGRLRWGGGMRAGRNISFKNILKNLLVLYRNDGLVIFKTISSPKFQKVKKDIQKLFKENGLYIIIQCNMKTVNYLDVTLNLENSTYHPYHKENNQIKYIY